MTQSLHILLEMMNQKPSVAQSYLGACTKQVRAYKIDDIALGGMMRKLRVAQKTSMRSMAATMGYSAPYISDLELGRRAWNLGLVEKYIASLPIKPEPYSFKIGRSLGLTGKGKGL